MPGCDAINAVVKAWLAACHDNLLQGLALKQNQKNLPPHALSPSFAQDCLYKAPVPLNFKRLSF